MEASRKPVISKKEFFGTRHCFYYYYYFFCFGGGSRERRFRWRLKGVPSWPGIRTRSPGASDFKKGVGAIPCFGPRVGCEFFVGSHSLYIMLQANTHRLRSWLYKRSRLFRHPKMNLLALEGAHRRGEEGWRFGRM